MPGAAPYYVIDDDDDDVQIIGVNNLNPQAADGFRLGEYRLDATAVDMTPRTFYQNYNTSYLGQPLCHGYLGNQQMAAAAPPVALEGISTAEPLQGAYQPSSRHCSAISESVSAYSSSSGETTGFESEPVPKVETSKAAWTGMAYGNILSVLVGPKNCEFPDQPTQLPPSFFSDLANTLVISFPFEQFASKHGCTIEEVNHALIAHVIAPLIKCHSVDKKQMEATATTIYNRWVRPGHLSNTQSISAKASASTKPDVEQLAPPPVASSAPIPQEQVAIECHSPVLQEKDAAPITELTHEEALAYAQVLLGGIAEYAFGTNDTHEAHNVEAPQSVEAIHKPQAHEATLNIQASQSPPEPQVATALEISPTTRILEQAHTSSSRLTSSASSSFSTPSAPSYIQKKFKRPHQAIEGEDQGQQSQLSRKRREDTPRPTKKAKFGNLVPFQNTCARKELSASNPDLTTENSEKINNKKEHPYVPLTEETRIRRHRVTVDPFGNYEKVSKYEDADPQVTQLLLSQGIPLSKHPRTKRELTHRDVEKINKVQRNFYKYAMKLQCDYMERLGLPRPIPQEHMVYEGEEEAFTPEDFYDYDDETEAEAEAEDC
ncbi:hypothetical protein MaudCBS49596_001261 [Microsporum audouinii]